jgi:hypothetical protein
LFDFSLANTFLFDFTLTTFYFFSIGLTTGYGVKITGTSATIRFSTNFFAETGFYCVRFSSS